jgi:hypothetical protein
MLRPVFVDRCWRHRGFFETNNLFVIGESKYRYELKIGPINYSSEWLPEIERNLAELGMIQWAHGTLFPQKMTFFNCLDETDAVIQQVLSIAFHPRNADQRLDDFHQAEVFVRDRSLHCTIGNLARVNRRFH